MFHVETENETLWFNKQPAHILGVYTDHQQQCSVGQLTADYISPVLRA